MRLGFAGTPAFARSALDALHRAGHDIAVVLTQPDRPAGRGLKLQASPVKARAVELQVPVLQPRSLRLDGKYPDDAQASRAALQAAGLDALVVAAYGLILPPWLLALPRLGCLNIHASLLPRWRGAAPIQRAIEAGDACTGITIMQMDAGLDTGDMLAVESVAIDARDTAASLQTSLAALGARLIVQALRAADAGTLSPQAQPGEGVTYADKISKAEAAVDWTAPAALVERRIRAFDPFPGASTQLGGETIKLWRAELAGWAEAAAPGTVLAVADDGVVVACGTGALRLTELQRPGGKRVPSRQFLQAAPPLRPGTVLGSPSPIG